MFLYTDKETVITVPSNQQGHTPLHYYWSERNSYNCECAIALFSQHSSSVTNRHSYGRGPLHTIDLTWPSTSSGGMCEYSSKSLRAGSERLLRSSMYQGKDLGSDLPSSTAVRRAVSDSAIFVSNLSSKLLSLFVLN